MIQQEERARAAISTYGSQRKRPYRINPETWEQMLFCGWVRKYFPDIARGMYSNQNGLEMKPKTKALLKSAGLNPGIPDLHIPFPVYPYHGLFVEMKRLHGGRTSDEQLDKCELLREWGHYVVICHGFQHAAKAFLRYLCNEQRR